MLKIIDALPDMHRKYNSELSKEILAFWKNDDARVAEVPVDQYVTVASAANSMRQTISRMNLGIRVIQKNGRVFLVKGGSAC